jgi:hypothetical protein
MEAGVADPLRIMKDVAEITEAGLPKTREARAI